MTQAPPPTAAGAPDAITLKYHKRNNVTGDADKDSVTSPHLTSAINCQLQYLVPNIIPGYHVSLMECDGWMVAVSKATMLRSLLLNSTPMR